MFGGDGELDEEIQNELKELESEVQLEGQEDEVRLEHRAEQVEVHEPEAEEEREIIYA